MERGAGGRGGRRAIGERLLSESANQTCSWEMVGREEEWEGGEGGAQRAQAAGSEGGAAAQKGRAAGQHLYPTAPTRFPWGSPRIPHGLTHIGRAHSENSKRKKAFGNSPELVKGKKYSLML